MVITTGFFVFFIMSRSSDMLGKQLVVINNLAPAKFMGLESQGMLLAVEDEKGVSLLKPDRDVAPGTKVH